MFTPLKMNTMIRKKYGCRHAHLNRVDAGESRK